MEMILSPPREKPGAVANVRFIGMPACYEGKRIDPRLLCFKGEADIWCDVHGCALNPFAARPQRT